MKRSVLPAHKRLLVALMNRGSQMAMGYQVAFTEELVRQHGFFGMMKHSGALTRIVNALMDVYGEVNAQVLCGLAATYNGCEYCSVGHLLAANLYHHRNTGTLLPVAETDVATLRTLTDAQLLQTLLDRFSGEQFTRLRELVRRQFELKMGTAQGSSDDDALLKSSLLAWDFLTECTLLSSFDEVPPLAAIAKDKQALVRYRAARAGSVGAGVRV